MVRVSTGSRPESFAATALSLVRTIAFGGLGIAVMPSWAVGDTLRWALTRILRRYEPPPTAVLAAYPSNGPLSKKVSGFVG